MTEKKHTVSESADKIVLTTNVKRGTETRDEDKIRVKVKGDDPTDAVLNLGKVLDVMQVEEIPELLRETQPGEDDE